MLAQEAAAAAGREVADRAAEEGDDARADARRGTWSRWRSKSPTMPCTSQPGYSSTSASARRADHALGDVERHVARAACPASCSASSRTRVFAAVPEPSSTSSTAPVSSAISAGARLEDRALGARRVVLGQLADAVEQLGAARVVEVLGRQLLERPREPVEHVVGERALVARRRGSDSIDGSSLAGGPVRLHRQASSRAARRRRSAGAAGGPSCGTSAVATRGSRRPRAAAQHAVAVAEEDLGVLAVGVGDEPRVAAERPTPSTPRPGRRPASAVATAGPPGRRLLPLRLGGEARTVRAGEGVGLEPGDVARRARPGALAATAAMVGDVVLLLPRPALVATTTRGARSRRPRRSAARWRW